MLDNDEITAGLPRQALVEFTDRQRRQFVEARPKSRLAGQSMQDHWLGRVPLHWMRDWPLPFVPYVDSARKAELVDIDGHRYDDFCLGDTGSMFGHSPPPVARAIRAQAAKGLTYMLPNADAAEAGAWLTRRFGPFEWQLTLTATDANRFALRVARAVTGRPRVLVFNGCYHGTVDDAMVELDRGRTRARPGLLGQVSDLSKTSVCVEFNDLAAVEKALARGDVAAILTEPALTNCAMVLPDEGFLAGLRRTAERHGTLLIIDETHTISTGLGGYCGVYGLKPDLFVVGKAVAGGVATGVWGMTAAVAARYHDFMARKPPGHSGMGTTLSANPLQFAALTANLSQVMTEQAYAKMTRGAARLHRGLARVVIHHQLDWHVVHLGARVEFICAGGPLANGTEAMRAHAPLVEAALHVGLLNRGSMIAPFHNMMLVSPVTSNGQIDRLVEGFDDVIATIKG